MGVASTVAMELLADGAISNLAFSIPNYLCTNFGAFIKKCTIDQLIRSTIRGFVSDFVSKKNFVSGFVSNKNFVSGFVSGFISDFVSGFVSGFASGIVSDFVNGFASGFVSGFVSGRTFLTVTLPTSAGDT